MASEGIYSKLIYRSNSLYNDGLKKARVRDLSGAIISLRDCLAINRRHTNARNLLGLVYFEMGEVATAIAQWIISRNNDPSKDNPALYYIEKVQSNQARLQTINQTLKKYNQALQYSYQGSFDLAIIQLKKVLSINENLISAYQLLGLVYIQTEEFEKARRTIVKGLRIDRNNTRLLTYLEEVDNILREIDMQSQDGKKKNAGKRPGSEVMSYESGMDTIIQPVHEKEHIGFSSIVNILIGIVVGVAVCYFLILPARIEQKQTEYDAMYKEVSDKLSEEQAQHNQDLAALSEVTQDKDKLTEELAKARGTNGYVRVEDKLIKAASIYVSSDGASQEVMNVLNEISEEELSDKSSDIKLLYDLLLGKTSPDVIGIYVDAAKTAMKSNDYEEAIAQYEKAYALNTMDSDVLMNLAHAYRQNGNLEKANELYRKISTDFPDTQNAQDALEYITEE